MFNKHNNVQVDRDATIPIELIRKQDVHGEDFFVGKCQFPGTLDLSAGISFRAYISDGDEQLYIGMPDEESKPNISRISHKRIYVKMIPITDGNNEQCFAGELSSPLPMPLSAHRGLWFTLFIKEGREELQITELRHKRYETADVQYDETGT